MSLLVERCLGLSISTVLLTCFIVQEQEVRELRAKHVLQEKEVLELRADHVNMTNLLAACLDESERVSVPEVRPCGPSTEREAALLAALLRAHDGFLKIAEGLHKACSP